MDLLHHLQSALVATYELQRELGGGGMSRVFVAQEVHLGSMVGMKFVAEAPPGGMSVVRFRRGRIGASMDRGSGRGVPSAR